MAMTPLPTLNRSSTSFREDVDTFFGSQLPAFAAEANALQADVTAQQSAAATSATGALASKNAAALSATAAATSATGALASKSAAALSATDAATSATASHDSDSAAAISALASQSSSDIAWTAMLTAINYLTTAQALISVPSTNLAINILGSAIMKPGTVFYSVEYGVPAAYVTYTAGVAQWNVAATDPATGLTAVSAARALASPLRAKGKVRILGSSGVDTVFVEPGSYVDLSLAGSGVDVIYLQGNFADYTFTQSGAANSVYTASRILASGEVETVRFTTQSVAGNADKIVFKDGYVNMDRAFVQPSGAALYNGVTTRALVAGDLNASLVTPAAFPADAILVDTNSPTDVFKCNGAAVSRAAYPYLLSRIGTRFGAGDGVTTFNLPSVTDLAVGVSAYIKA